METIKNNAAYAGLQPITSSSSDGSANKVTQAFARARAQGRGVLIPYFMCGYPSAELSAEIILAAAEGGADIIELGMPFSDPLADGATIQHAGQVALNHGMTIKGCLRIASQIAQRSDVALLLMGYYNPLLSYGIERFCADAKANGVSGFIIPDLPVEEAAPLQQAAAHYGLTLIYLIPPTAPDRRIEQVVQSTLAGPGGFIYCVSLSGVTGSRSELPAHLQEFITRIRKHLQGHDIPLAVGFGLSTPEHIATVARYAEGSVVGSALINLIDQHQTDDPAAAIKEYIQSLKAY
jgi:tryptophan synthase alpha chain